MVNNIAVRGGDLISFGGVRPAVNNRYVLENVGLVFIRRGKRILNK